VGKCLWGDKDTYRIAFQLAGKEHIFYSIQHQPLQALSRPSGLLFLHAGMVQRGLLGELLFLHRTAAGKMWPHCARSQGQSCLIWGVTGPVDQEQLLASVVDPTEMQFQPSKLDLKWQDKHCFKGAAAVSANWDSNPRGWTAGNGRWDGGSDVVGDGGSMARRGVAADYWRVDAADGFAGVGVEALGAAAAELPAAQQPQVLSTDYVFNDWQLAPAAAAAAAAAQQATLLDCELDKAQHLLPIPAIAVVKLPKQVRHMLDAAFEVFIESAT
jgi:hypothetical protein